MRALKAMLAGVVLALGLTSAADAVTVEFNNYLTGRDLGDTVLATLEAEQVGRHVEFTLTNVMTTPLTSFISQLFLTYTGSLRPVGRENVAGVATSGFVRRGSIANAGLDFQFMIRWPSSNSQDRLNPGESSTFRLKNTTLAGFFQGDNFAMIHANALGAATARTTGGTSTKYTGTIAPVPVPAAGLMLLGALGGLAALRRRKAA
jgi:hypothetical protein